MDSPPTLPASFPAPPGGETPDLLVVAGEHSGDQHAAIAVRDLLALNPGLKVAVLGGPALRETGATFLYDLTQSSVVGVFEVLKHFGFYKALFEKVLNWIEVYRPRTVCFVDNPGLNLRLCAALHRRGLSRKAGGGIQLLYYIAPQIWAWKKRRRFDMARYLDGAAVIFPFEPDSYRDTDLPVRFVGHPFLAENHEPFLRYDSDGPVLLLPGSRRIAVGRILPVLLEGFAALRKERPEIKATIVTPDDEIRSVVKALLESYSHLASSVTLAHRVDRLGARAVLTSSGTMSLSCALAGIPGAIVYRANPLTYWLGRMVIAIPYLGIANLLLNKPMYPEYLQGKALPERLAAELRECLDSGERIRTAREDAEKLRMLLSAPGSMTAGRWLEARVAGPDGSPGPPDESEGGTARD